MWVFSSRSVVRVLVEMLAPYKGRVFDPCCCSAGMFVQSEKFVEAHGDRIGEIAIYGRESNPTTWLARLEAQVRTRLEEALNTAAECGLDIEQAVDGDTYFHPARFAKLGQMNNRHKGNKAEL